MCTDQAFVLEGNGTEVEKEGALQASRLQIVDRLRVVDASKRIKRLGFHDDFTKADKVRPIERR
jgi:hypothetical protein